MREVDGSAAQRAAVGFRLGQRVVYIWGPPGTGKTGTLALLVHALRQRGEQVLIVAHTNAATDTAMRRVLDAGALPAGAALRLGPYGDALAGRGVGLDEAVDRVLRAENPRTVERLPPYRRYGLPPEVASAASHFQWFSCRQASIEDKQ